MAPNQGGGEHRYLVLGVTVLGIIVVVSLIFSTNLDGVREQARMYGLREISDQINTARMLAAGAGAASRDSPMNFTSSSLTSRFGSVWRRLGNLSLADALGARHDANNNQVSSKTQRNKISGVAANSDLSARQGSRGVGTNSSGDSGGSRDEVLAMLAGERVGKWRVSRTGCDSCPIFM
jgi:hypothetical protein